MFCNNVQNTIFSHNRRLIELTDGNCSHSFFQDKIRLLQEDLESERELRNRIERERADLSVQLIALTDRLEDAEGTTDSQVSQ